MAKIVLLERLLKLSIGMVVVVAVTGCQTLTTSTCSDTEWNAEGFADGEQGLDPADIWASIDLPCTTSVSDLELQEYIAGYETGLSAFCTFQNGEEQAVSGLENQLRCSELSASSFNEGYRMGLLQFCTPSGGTRHGERVGDYQGTCPTTIEQEFLSHYLRALENGIPSLYSEIMALQVQLNQVNSRVNHLQQQEWNYDTAIELARLDNKSDRAEYLRGRRTDTKFEILKAKTIQFQIEENLQDVLKKRDTINQMLDRWRPHLRDVV